MRLAESSRIKIESFFKYYFQNDEFKLPEIKIYDGKFTEKLMKIVNASGITFGKKIFIFPEIISINSLNKKRLPDSLAVHEIAHVLQYLKHGFLGFLYVYLRDYYKNLKNEKDWSADSRQKAYLNIPFEVEAREIAWKYLEWKEEFKE